MVIKNDMQQLQAPYPVLGLVKVKNDVLYARRPGPKVSRILLLRSSRLLLSRANSLSPCDGAKSSGTVHITLDNVVRTLVLTRGLLASGPAWWVHFSRETVPRTDCSPACT